MEEERFLTLIRRYGHITDNMYEIEEKGLSMVWRIDERMVNQGSCFYNDELKVYYMKAAIKGIADCRRDKRDLHWLEIERNIIDDRYNKIQFSILPPDADRNKKKIQPCPNHLLEFGKETFFTICMADGQLPDEIKKGDSVDTFIFDIGKEKERFIHFKVRFWCWSCCAKPHFTNRKLNLQFKATMFGENVEPMKVVTDINVQQNPGRGAKIVVPQPQNSKIKQNIPFWMQDINMNDRPGSSGMDRTEHNRKNLVNFIKSKNNQRINIVIDLPRNYYEMMGESQGMVEVEAVKREIMHLANFRLMDALHRKVNANNDIVKENMNLKHINQEMNGMLEMLNGQARHLLDENTRLKNAINQWNRGRMSNQWHGQGVNQWNSYQTESEAMSLNLNMNRIPPPPPSDNSHED